MLRFSIIFIVMFLLVRSFSYLTCNIRCKDFFQEICMLMVKVNVFHGDYSRDN